MADTKTCTKCNETLPVTQFYKRKNMRGGLQSWCIPCTKSAVRIARGPQAGATGPEPVPFFRIWDVWPLFQPQDAQPKTKTFADLVRRFA
jgi:hypothetical protein